MGNVGYRFTICLFTSFFWFFVFVNFLGWSGLSPSMILGVGNNDNWSNSSYFGVSSLFNMLKSLTDYNGVFAFDVFGQHFEIATPKGIWDTLGHLVSLTSLNIPEIVSKISSLIESMKSGDIFNLLLGYVGLFKAIIEAIIQPIELLLYSIYLLIQVLIYFVGFIVFFFKAVAGTYNSPMADLSSLYDYWDSYVITSA